MTLAVLALPVIVAVILSANAGLSVAQQGGTVNTWLRLNAALIAWVFAFVIHNVLTALGVR